MLDSLKSLPQDKYSPANNVLSLFNLFFVMRKDVNLQVNKNGWSFFPRGVHLSSFHMISTLTLGYVLVHMGLCFPFLSGQ